MRKLIALWLILFAGIYAAHAQGWLPLVKPGAVAYTGPGDTTTFFAWNGMRAYSAADRGNSLVNVCNVSDVACVDMVSSATTGNLVVTTVGGSDCSVVVCTIKTMYDRSGGSNCAGACDATQATINQRPLLITSCQNSLPCARFANANATQLVSANTSTASQPVTVYFVAKRTTVSIANPYSPGALQTGFDTTSGNLFMYDGLGLPIIAATEGAYHALHSVFNGASSTFCVDNCGGSPTTVSTTPGSNGITAAPIQIGASTGSNRLTGDFVEGGVVAAGVTGTNQTTVNVNAKNYWNF